MKRSGRILSLPALAGALLTLPFAALLASTPASVAGSAEAGQAKAVVCAACHGADGNSLNPEWPSLAGQNEIYLVRQLQAFKKGDRSNVLMSTQAMTLADQDMADLAAYFASKVRQPKTADPALVTTGERLYRGGNKESGIAACISCHGPNGAGNGPAGYPSIGGQHATYAAAQLRLYRGSQRCADSKAAAAAPDQRCSDLNQMMRNNTVRLTDDEINAVASYIQGLR